MSSSGLRLGRNTNVHMLVTMVGGSKAENGKPIVSLVVRNVVEKCILSNIKDFAVTNIEFQMIRGE